MSKPFFERLAEYYSNIGQVLRGAADVASIFPNATDIGNSRERIYAEILKLHLPSSCNVSLGGFLFDLSGNESNQMDILIINDDSIQYNFQNKDGSGKSFACIDGCVGVVSVKSKLDSTTLVDALYNIASIPDKQPLVTPPFLTILQYDDWPYKVIYASDGVSLETLFVSLNRFYDQHSEIPNRKRPNLIHVAGKYVVMRTSPGFKRTRDGTILAENIFHPMFSDARGKSADAFALMTTISEMQEIASASKYVKYVYSSMINEIPL